MTGIDKSTKKKCQRREGIYKKSKKRKRGERKSESFGGDKEGLDQQASQGGTIAVFLVKYISVAFLLIEIDCTALHAGRYFLYIQVSYMYYFYFLYIS